MDNPEVVRRALDSGVHLVSFLYCDNGGVTRGKATHVSMWLVSWICGWDFAILLLIVCHRKPR